MTNPYYNPTGAPAQGSAVTSAVVRTEFAAIQAGFDKMPVLTGNAYEILRVKGDESGFEASGLILDASGRLLHGATSAFDISPAGTGQYPSIGSFSTTNIFPFVGGVFSDDANGCNWTSIKSRATSVGSHVIVQNADQIGGMLFRADDGVTFRNCAAIYAHVDGTPAVNQMPGRLIFSVAPSGGAATVVEKMRIASDGTVTLGGLSTAPALKVNAYTAGNWVTISSGTNPTIGTSAGDLSLTSAANMNLLNSTINLGVSGPTVNLLATSGASTMNIRNTNAASNLNLDFSTTGTLNLRSHDGATAFTQVSVSHTASANRYITLTGSFGGNPTIGTSAGVLKINCGLAISGSYAVTTSTATVTDTMYMITVNYAGTCTLTLPAAASYAGRILRILTYSANTVVSASSNVVPITLGAAGPAILAATAGKWADLMSDGTNWRIIAAN